MPPAAVDTLPLAGSVPHDLSIIALFLQADTIVKIVMLILLLASFWSWAVIFDKAIRLRRLRHAAANFEESFWSGGSLDDLYDRVGQRPADPMTAVFSPRRCANGGAAPPRACSAPRSCAPACSSASSG